MSHAPSQVNLRSNEKRTLESRLSSLIKKHPIITATAIILPIFFRAHQLNLYGFKEEITYPIAEFLEIRKRPAQPIPQVSQPSQTQFHYSTNSLEYSSTH